MMLLPLLSASLCLLALADDIFIHPTCVMCKCNFTTQYVNCSGTNLFNIPKDPTGSTMVLNMSFTKLRVVNDTALETYQNLQVLDLSSTSLHNISDSAFNASGRLKYLNLSNNERLPMTQNTVSPKVFSPLSSLKELKIYGNTGTYNRDGYPDRALSELKTLESLWIDGLTNISFGLPFRSMESLKTIMIPGDIIQPPWRFCETAIIDTMLDNLIHITNFTMRKCGVKVVGENAFSNMISLIHLDLSFNRLLTLAGVSKAFPSLGYTQLEVLVLNNVENVLKLTCGPSISKDIARALKHIKTLKEIHIEYNALNGLQRDALEELPDAIEYINVKRNEFELGFYTFEAYHLKNLKRLDVSYNFFADDNEIWHHQSKYHERESTMAISNNNDHSRTKRNVKPNSTEFIDSVSVRVDSNQSNSSTNGSNTKYPNNNKHMLHGSHFFDFLKGSPQRRSTDFVQHMTNLLDLNLKMNMNAGKLKPDTGLETSYEGRVCLQSNPYIPPGTIIAYLPPKLENVDISHSKMAHPIPELYFNETNSVKEIHASNSLLYCWDGPIHGLDKLEYVDLSLNLCTNVSLVFFDKALNLKTLLISKNFLFVPIQADEDGRLLQNLNKLEILDMSYNRIQKLPYNFLKNQANLRILDLCQNLLDTFNIKIDHMTQLEEIDISGNFMQSLPTETRDNLVSISERNFQTTKKTLNVNLRDNKLLCYCSHLDFLQWVYEHMSNCRFLDIDISTCTFENDTDISINSRKHFGEVLDHLKTKCTSHVNLIIGASVALCVLLNVFIGVVIHRFRWKIRYWYYVAPVKENTRNGYISIDSLNALGSRYKYDIYISSVTEDKTFVMDRLKARLEIERYRFFIQDDDIVPGQNIYSMIANAIHVSRVVIFVISEGCESDKEWKIAMRMAHEESLKRGHSVFFGIFIDHEPGTPYNADVREIRQRSFLDYPGDEQPINDQEQIFWLPFLHRITETGSSEVLTFELGIQ